jgi:NOL1/NOP2/sun family putative RNA methylase
MNEEFLERMKDLLGKEYPDYLACMQEQPRRGFRVNTLKTDAAELFACSDLHPQKSPFAANGYYTDAPAGVGFTPAYLGGLFYLQEPSASAAVTILDPKPGMKVLDLCAAPGSKTTQIAEALQGSGYLVANEYAANRSGILVENVERCGTPGCTVLNADTKDVADAFAGFFDMVLCDAPCSGEGMFRKNEEAQKEWSLANVKLCAERQAYILDNAYRCLNKGGTLVYSTCTFAVEENEAQVLSFLERHPDMEMVDAGVSFGRRALDYGHGISKAVRIFPMDGGEGHFIAKMRKQGEPEEVSLRLMKSDPLPKFVREFLQDQLQKPYPYYLLKQGRLYGGTAPFVSCGKCRIRRHQVYLGEVKQNRFEPSHHFYMSSFTGFLHTADLNEEEIRRYLHGEQISHPCKKGWTAVAWRGHIMGGGKSDGRVIKNKYPKQYRI